MNTPRSASHMDAMSKLKFRDYDELVDDQMLLSIPRIPPTVITNGLIAVSHPITYTARPSLTPKNHIMITDSEEDRIVGVYAYTMRQMRILDNTKMGYYAFDCNIMPEQRNNGLSLLVLDNMLTQPMKQDNTIVYASSLKTRANVVVRKTGTLGVRHFCDLYQHAWHVDFPVKLDQVPKDVEIKIWEERDTNAVKSQWDAYYGTWLFAPTDFNEILVYNKKYYMATYNASLRRKGSNKYSRASISIWNQDLIFTLISSKGIESHRQIFCCYSTGEDGDYLFRYLLHFVHNEQHKQGVRFLFIGLSEMDPIKKHFPLFKSIQSLIFSFLVLTKEEEEWEKMLKVKYESPVYNDPRDYGVLMLHRDYTSNANL